MTRRPRAGAGPIGVVLVADVDGDPVLCGRPAVDWLLDTVEELDPVFVAVTGDDTSVRERIALRPSLREALHARRPDEAGVVVLPCSAPLIRPATVRRAWKPNTTVTVDLVREAPWWADEPPAPPSGFRVTGVEALSVNDPADRVAASNALYRYLAACWLAKGVLIEDPATTRIDATVHIGPGVRIRPYTELIGTTVVGRGSCIGPTTTIRECRVGEDCEIEYSVCQYVQIGDRNHVGPYAWLRSGTQLGADCRAGAFVELADSVVGDGTSIPHLGGLFSADVGRNCNIAGMSAPANTNNGVKNRVRIGDGVSIGAANVLVAPVSLGDGSCTAAGTILTEDVPAGALAMSRGQQRNVLGWAALRQRQSAGKG
jgi:acetyltransferase-like isoleucine patch superfamily enzyme